MAYGDDPGFAAYLADMGYVLPEGSPSAAVLRARGSAYLDATYEPHWSGDRTGGYMQLDGWPRAGAKLNCRAGVVPDDVIPPAIVNAAYRAAWLEASSPGILSASMTAGQRVAREKVDVIEVAYHDDGAKEAGQGGVAFIDAEIDGAMRAFICETGDTGLGVWAVGS